MPGLLPSLVPQTVRRVIARAPKEPLELVDVVIPDPGPTDVVVMVGVPASDTKPDAPLHDFFCHGGGLPKRDFPMLVNLALQGRLALHKFVSKRIRIDDIETASSDVHRGEVLRSGALLDEAASGQH
jgi:Zn-dependent alcohol dehydrogenase